MTYHADSMDFRVMIDFRFGEPGRYGAHLENGYQFGLRTHIRSVFMSVTGIFRLSETVKRKLKMLLESNNPDGFFLLRGIRPDIIKNVSYMYSCKI